MEVVLNINDYDVNNMKDGDILVYNKAKNYFYRTTAESFFCQYEQKLNALLKKYDSQVNNLVNENKKLKEENENFKKTLENNFEKFETNMKTNFETLFEKNKEINKKLIEMVENVMEATNK